jgi:hypothetical protein
MGLVALGIGTGLGVLVSSGQAEETDTVVRTITDADVETEERTVTHDQTVTEEKTVTETETVEVPAPPAEDGYAGGGADDTDGDGCSDSYDAYSCVPPYEGDDLNCADVGATDIEVIGDDLYGLDGYDGDGIACES